MPAGLARRQRAPVIPVNVPVIDLTADDEDDTVLALPLRAVSQASPVLQTRTFGSLGSNHGLWIDASFSDKVAAATERPRQVLEYPSILPNTGRPSKRRKLDEELPSSDQERPNGRHEGTSPMSPSQATSQHNQEKGTPSNRAFRDAANISRTRSSSQQNLGGLGQLDQATTKPQNRANSGVLRRRSSNERLHEFLTARVMPRIVDIVQRYSFREADAEAVERKTLERLFENKDLEQQVEKTVGRLSTQAWKMLDERAEMLVAGIAAETEASLRGAKRPPIPKTEAPKTSIAPSLSIEQATASEGEQYTSTSPRRTARLGLSSVSTYNLKVLTANGRHRLKASDKGSQKEKKSHVRVAEVRSEPRRPVDNAAVTKETEKEKKAKFAAKMSKIMKGRWERGEMDSVVQLRKESLALKSTVSPPSSASRLDVAAKAAATTSAGKSARKLSIAPQGSAEAGNIYAHALQLSSDSSDDSDLESTSHTSTHNANATHTRGYSSSPTTSFSAEGTKENTPARHSQRITHIKEPYFQSSLPRSTSLQSSQAPKNQSRGRFHNRRRRKPKSKLREVAAYHERDGLRYASLDPNLDHPYLDAQSRSDIARGLPEINQRVDSVNKLKLQKKIIGLQGIVLHVDFSTDEIEHLVGVIKNHVDIKLDFPPSDSREYIQELLQDWRRDIPILVNVILAESKSSTFLARRSPLAISAFLRDAASGVLSAQPAVVRLSGHTSASHAPSAVDSISSILLSREIHGKRRRPQWDAHSRARLIASIEDTLAMEAVWTDCAGDLSSITWLPDHGFICGTVTHSDEHNQQYNKPGNLMVGSTSTKTLKSITGHRIKRPIIEKGENSRPEMRETQDPWLYTSVTSTAWSDHHKKCFTGSFDNSVQIWDVCDDRSSMKHSCTWTHDGHVNFVVTSPDHDMIATAADVKEGAIRVYKFNPENPSESEFSTYSGDKADEQALRKADTWAYFPATIQWGKSPSVQNLLLVGYSPRSYDPHDEVPEIHANTGELCLWNMMDGSRIPITSARTQNVFEVIWHPSQPMFVAGTSPTGAFDEGVKTQLRIFGQTEFGAFAHMATLDCKALDINEITIMPNSQVKCYVTASCTDGCTYVWDSAESDQPIRVLRHGKSIDDQALGGDDADNGVKFAAWGKTADRFYTGSSDGVLKCWNIRAPQDAVLVRDVATLSGGISAGVFSPNFEKLLIGDSTGKVHLFSLDDMEPGDRRPPVMRKALIPHTEPSPSLSQNQDVEPDSERTAAEIAREFIAKGQILIHKDEYIGAIQGPDYASTNLFAPADHKHNDPTRRVRRAFRKEQAERYQNRSLDLPRLQGGVCSSNTRQHASNMKQDLDLTVLGPSVGLDLVIVDDGDFTFELGPRFALLDLDEDEEDMLSTTEVEDLVSCTNQISQELELQRSLEVFFKELNL